MWESKESRKGADGESKEKTWQRLDAIVRRQKILLKCPCDTCFHIFLLFFPKASLMLGFSFSCWNRVGAIRRRRIRGRYGYHTTETNLRTLFAAGVQLLGSETTETNLRTLLLGWRCCGARRRRRICGRCCYHAIWSCWGAAAGGERYGGDESADGAVTMLFAAVGAQLLRNDTEETNLRTLLLPCYLQVCWGAGAGERDGGEESADAAVTMLFAAVGVELLGSETEETNLRTVLLPCYLQLLGRRCWGARLRRRICGRCSCHAICSCWGGGAGEWYGGDESADGAVAMLFAAVGVQLLGSETAETNLRTVLLPCYLQLLCWRCWRAIRRRRICGRCCYHAICSCWGAAAGERYGGDESADGAVAGLFAAVGVQLLGSETEETNLRTLLLPCYLQLLGGETAETNLRTVLLPCYLQL